MLEQIREAEVHRPVPVIYYHGTPAENQRRDAVAVELGAVGATYVPGQLYRWALYALMRSAVLDDDDIRYIGSLIPGDVAQRVARSELAGPGARHDDLTQAGTRLRGRR